MVGRVELHRREEVVDVHPVVRMANRVHDLHLAAGALPGHAADSVPAAEVGIAAMALRPLAEIGRDEEEEPRPARLDELPRRLELELADVEADAESPHRALDVLRAAGPIRGDVVAELPHQRANLGRVRHHLAAGRPVRQPLDDLHPTVVVRVARAPIAVGLTRPRLVLIPVPRGVAHDRPTL